MINMLRQADQILNLEEEEEEEEEEELGPIQPYSEMEFLEKKEKEPNTKSADQDVLDDIKSLEPQEIKILIELATQRLRELDKEKSEEKMELLNPWKSKAPELVVQGGQKKVKPSKVEPKTSAAVLDMKATVSSIPQLQVGQVVQPSAVQKLQKKNPDLEQIRRVFSKMDPKSQVWLLFNLQQTVNRECEDDSFFGIELGSNGKYPGFQFRNALKLRKNAAGKVIGKDWENVAHPIMIKRPSTRKGVRSQEDYELTWEEFKESGKDWSLVFNLLTEWYPSCITICKVCERIGSEEDIKNHLPKSGVCGQKSKKDCWHGSKCRMETCVFKHPESRPRIINFASKGRSVVGCCDKC